MATLRLHELRPDFGGWTIDVRAYVKGSVVVKGRVHPVLSGDRQWVRGWLKDNGEWARSVIVPIRQA